MEIYGLYAAAHAAASSQPLCFALKAVCDLADSEKEDGQRRYAAYASARVLQMLVERFGPLGHASWPRVPRAGQIGSVRWLN
jgi:hypothetical protein